MHFSHLKTIQHLIETYKHREPLSLFLKSYFRLQKKFGSHDRRFITEYVYDYYRLGSALKNFPFSERLNAAGYLAAGHWINKKQDADGSASTEKRIVTSIPVGDNSFTLQERIEKIKEAYESFSLTDVFPFYEELSTEVNAMVYEQSLLTRPKVFIRIRKGYEKEVEEEFRIAGFLFEMLNSSALMLDQETKLTATKSFERGLFEIQDYSSQLTANYFDAEKGQRWWDCCAGSGGKSLLFKDKFPEISLTLSDVRSSVLKNAAKRLEKTFAGNYEIRTIDLTSAAGIQGASLPAFDGIILDAPCTGSGTWARTPEEISFFEREMIEACKSRQIQISANVSSFLKPGGLLIYITCSVFKKENEEVIEHLTNTTPLRLIKSQLIKGYEHSGDTLFIAALKMI